MWQTIAASAATAVATVVVAWLAYKGNTKAKHIEGATPSYAALDDRMARAEQQIDALRATVSGLLDSQHEDRLYIRRLIAERPMGLPLPLPMPGWLNAPIYTPHTPSSIIQRPEA